MFVFFLAGLAKSQNSSQMNLSGSSSSLTSDASTKTGTVSLRSFGIGGALLHKRILQMTRQHDREMEGKLEENPEKERQETEAGWSFERSGRPWQTKRQRVHTNAGFMPMKAREESGTQKSREEHLGVSSAPQGPELKPTPPKPQILKPPSEFTIRKRLMSPFRALRERSQSRERLHPNREEGAERRTQNETQEQAEQEARSSASSAPFLCLYRNRHARRKTV